MTAPNVQNMTFGASIAAPLAQVTVIDGNEGDCNIVDFCHLPLNGSNYAPKSWRRTIIDTGPSSNQFNPTRGDEITNTLVNVATELCFPKLDGQSTWQPVQAVDELQITHPDDDHIGNAASFLDAMCKSHKDKIRGAIVSYGQIPPLFCKPIIVAQHVERAKLEGRTVCQRVYRAVMDSSWQEAMEQAGFVVQARCWPDEHESLFWDLETHEAQWDAATQASSGTDTCTLSYTKSGATDGLGFTLSAEITIYLDDGDLRSTTKLGKKTTKNKNTFYAATVSRKKDALGSLFKRVPLSRDLREYLSREDVQFNIDKDMWKEAAVPKKKNKKASLSDPSQLMSSMTLSASSQPLNDPGLVGSVKQVVSLRTKIIELNSFPTDAQLRPIVPLQGQSVGRQTLIGPSLPLHQRLMRHIMLNRYALAEVNALDDGMSKNTIKDDVVNRASVITMFERRDSMTARDANFTMLFTGDAFDASCDIRDTLMSWNPQLVPPTLQLDVLKIPHHGSDRTTSSGFYKYCRAFVYIISAAQQNTHGNPKISSLKAIVSGFKDKTAPGGQPFRIFFSNVDADKDWESTSKASRSAAKALLKDPDLKPGPNYYYEMYKPKASTSDNFAACGSILFGTNGSNTLVTTWDQNSWVKMTAT